MHCATAKTVAPADINPDTSNTVGTIGAEPVMAGWKIALYLTLGIIGLPLGAHILVDSASEIARLFGMREAIIGLTLVVLGKSLLELASNITAALHRQADVALGNVIGSDMLNGLAIIGLTTLVGPVPVDTAFLTFDLCVMLGAKLLLIPFVFFNWNITRRFGIGLTALYLLYVNLVLILSNAGDFNETGFGDWRWCAYRAGNGALSGTTRI